MESLLVGVTLVSLFLAAAMAVVAWTLIRAERDRAAARIEALEALAFEPAAEEVPQSVAQPAAGAPQWDAALGAATAAPPDRTHWADYAAATHAEGMFDTAKAPGGNGRRWIAVAAVGLVVVTGYFGVVAFRSPRVAAAVAGTSSDLNGDDVPIELVSLRHAVGSDGAFVVTGLVQNPASGRGVPNVEAVVYLFDDQDQYFTSGRARVDASTLGPGAEASFEVRIPSVTGVSRYRVGFREADGRTVAHVDRRGQMLDGTTVDAAAGGDVDVVRPAGGMRPMASEAGR
jgi:hypothetical protein